MKYYIMVDPGKPDFCKLGISIDPSQRIKAYRTAAPDCYFKKIYDIPDIIHERKILSLLSESFKVNRETVHCNPTIVQNIIEGYFTDVDIAFA
jgi:hypothetical protein